MECSFCTENMEKVLKLSSFILLVMVGEIMLVAQLSALSEYYVQKTSSHQPPKQILFLPTYDLQGHLTPVLAWIFISTSGVFIVVQQCNN